LETSIHLLLWRHAEAEEGWPDLQRKLTARGEQQAQQMAEWINAHAPRSLRILASPAVRTQQTARALGQAFETDPRLAPDARVEDLLEALNGPAESRTGKMSKSSATLIVGHQPTLGQTASFLLSGAQADWTIKKGAVWWLSSRSRHGKRQTLVQAVMSCALLGKN
jgi:phosphohistidine phosphatase